MKNFQSKLISYFFKTPFNNHHRACTGPVLGSCSNMATPRPLSELKSPACLDQPTPPTHPNHAKQMCWLFKKIPIKIWYVQSPKVGEFLYSDFFWEQNTSDFCILPKALPTSFAGSEKWPLESNIGSGVCFGREFLKVQIRALKKSEYIYIYIYTLYIWYIYVYMYVYTYTFTYMYIYAQLHSDVYIYIHIFICIHIYATPPKLGVQVHMLLVGFVKAGLNWGDDFVQKWIVKLSLYDKCRCFESIKPS